MEIACDAVLGTPSAEICDDRDNDCDGEVDEDIAVTIENCSE